MSMGNIKIQDQAPFSLIIFFFAWFSNAQQVGAIEIIEPSEGAKVEAGTNLRIVVKPQPGENWRTVALDFEGLTLNPNLGFYERTFPIPRDIQLGVLDLHVTALDHSGQEVELTRKVIIALPSNVILQKLIVSPNPVFLTKLLPGSDPNKVRAFETKKLGVGGMYSDGIQRDTSSADSGTTYQSSNEKVVTIDSNGNITAMGPGRASVIVRNRDQSVKVNVVVKQKS